MFLNKTQFKKMIKTSFNSSGIRVGNVYDGLVLAGSHWITWTESGSIPNWVKAAIMEYTGELPAPGTMFKAKKKEPIQYEIPDQSYYNLPEYYLAARTPLIVTPVVIDNIYGQYRLMQFVVSKKIILVPDQLFETIDLAELEDESAPVGPCTISEESDLLVWKNECSAFAFVKCRDFSGKEDEAVKLLQQIKFGEDA